MQKIIRSWAFYPLVFAIIGCFGSPYYIGINGKGENQVKGFVSKKTEEEARAFEIEFLKVLFGEDIKGLKDVLTPKVYQSMGKDRERFFLGLMESRYGVTGKSMVLRHTENIRKSIFNKSLKQDGFSIYNYLAVSLWMEGTKRDARLDIYLTKWNGKIRACGFRIRDLEYDHRGYLLDESVLVPEK